MVEGLDRLNARFNAIPKRVRDAAEKELERIAAEIVDTMKRFAPVDTGALRESIGWTWGDAPEGALKIGKVGGREYGSLSITIYAGGAENTGRRQARSSGTRRRDWKRGTYFDVDVAIFQEFGTSKMRANPFFYPAWRANRKKAKARLTRAINKAIKS
jgi:HK97 gp10 family phage protein